jgi:TM2 domain-containing membrane protein YozV
MKKPESSAPIAALSGMVSSQLKLMSLVMVAILGLVAFAHEFVLGGILSNIYLNGLIIVLFVFGAALSFKRVLTVRNDAIAFAALEEAYNDTRTERVEALDDPYWRHYRAMQPGIVFSRPRSIGHMFDLAYDEVLKSKNLQISVATLQNITHGIDSRLADERSLGSYLTGLLIFLGLIGTFIGLMEMVGSIGTVISNLTGSTGNPAESMKRLLSDLQKPLTGMAMGFSSSLFGLFGSLTLGLLARFGSKCQASLKDTFEGWLASIAHLETGKGGEVGDLARLIADSLMGGNGEKGTGQASGGGGGGPVMSDMGMVATMAQGFSRMQTSMEAMNTTLPKLLEIGSEQTAVMRAVLTSLDRLGVDTSDVRESARVSVVSGQTTNESLQEVITLARINEQKLTSGFNGMAHVMEVTGQAYLDGLRRLTAENYETNARLAKLLDVKAAGDKITEIAGSIESKVKSGVGSMTIALDRTASALESGMHKMAAEQADLKQVLVQLQSNGGNGGVSAEFEDKLTAGFTELSRSMETVFAAYAQIVNRSLVSNAMGAGDGSSTLTPIAQQTNASLPEHEAKQAAKADIDHEALRQRLYTATASGFRDSNVA